MIDGMGVSNTKLGLLLTVYTIVSYSGAASGRDGSPTGLRQKELLWAARF